MHRMQVQLTRRQEQMLKDLARMRGASISALVREGVELLLEPLQALQEQRTQAGLALIGYAGPDPEGATNVSDEHDRYLADIYAGRAEDEV